MKSNLFVLGYIAIIIVAIIFTTSIIHKPTRSRSDAAKGTTLSFDTIAPVNTGQAFNVTVLMDPGANYVSYVNLVVNYDSTILTPASTPITPGTIPGTNPAQQYGIFDGPTKTCNGNQCSIAVALSIGNDFTKAAKAKGTLAQVNFTATANTDANGTPVTFDTTTQVYSVAPSDSSNENVLLSTSPGKVVVGGQGGGSTPTPATSPTPLPSGVTPTPTNTPAPLPSGVTTTPTTAPTGIPTFTPAPGQTTGNLSVHFEAIDGLNNLNPKHPQRKVMLQFYKSNNFSGKPDAVVTDYVTHVIDSTTGIFTDQIANLTSVSPGAYYILARSPEGSLREQLTSQQVTIAAGQNNILTGSANGGTTTVPNFRMGDLNNDNLIDVTDYNILIDCYSIKQSGNQCKSHNITDTVKGNYADLNDDNKVDGIDYNILIRHLGENGY